MDKLTSSEELLNFIAHKEKNEEEAKLAFEIFFKRYEKFLYYLFLNRFYKIIDSEEMKDVIQETMIKVWKKADLYNPNVGSVHNWLAYIAQHTCYDYFKKKSHIVLHDENFWEGIKDKFQEKELMSLENRGHPLIPAVQKCISLLSERERDIIQTTFHFYPNRINDNTLNKLANKWSTTIDSIRQIRKRALSKIKSFLIDYFPEEDDKKNEI
jgi:RNA polymerase sigma factor (sigma-70 family)